MFTIETTVKPVKVTRLNDLKEGQWFIAEGFLCYVCSFSHGLQRSYEVLGKKNVNGVFEPHFTSLSDFYINKNNEVEIVDVKLKVEVQYEA